MYTLIWNNKAAWGFQVHDIAPTFFKELIKIMAALAAFHFHNKATLMTSKNWQSKTKWPIKTVGWLTTNSLLSQVGLIELDISQSRPDIAHDNCQLGTKLNKATVEEFIYANEVIKKKKIKHWRLVCFVMHRISV